MADKKKGSQVEVIPRDENGKFAKGVSGNPAGRPVGVKNYGSSLRLTDIFRDLSPMLLEDLMERFRAGDEKARDFLLPRLWPESPKFAAYMHEKARDEEDWRENTRKAIEEEIRLEKQRENDATKRHYLEYYLPEVLVKLFVERGNFKIPNEFMGAFEIEDIDRAYIPAFDHMTNIEACLFAVNLVHAVIMKPAAARAALEEAKFSEGMIFMVFESIRKKHGSSLSGLLFIGLVDPFLSQNLEESAYDLLVNDLNAKVRELNHGENRARERMFTALCEYDDKDDEYEEGGVV